MRESLLDMKDVMSGVDSSIIDSWLESNVKGKYKLMKLKNGTRKCWGSLIIRNYKSDTFPVLNLSYVEGDIYIEHCDPTSLEGLFAPDCTIKGSLHITDCPNIKDLLNGPKYVYNWLYITSCKMFKSLEGMPTIVGDISIMKCGKKFTRNTIGTAAPTAKTILCSEEDVEANLTEALMEPTLLKMMDQIKKRNLPLKLQKIVGDRFKLDQITPSMKSTFRYNDESKMATALRKIFANTNPDWGFAVLEDKDGNVVEVWTHERIQYHLRNPYTFEWYDRQGFRSGRVYTSITSIIRNFSAAELSNRDVLYVHVYNMSEASKLHGDMEVWKIRSDRSEARSGMIDMSPEGLKRMLRDQQDRYKIAVKQIKALRNSEQYVTRANKVKDLLERFAKMVQKVISDPSWAAARSWKLDEVYDAFQQGYTPATSYNKRPTQRYGVIYVFKNWSTKVVDTQTGQSTYGGINNDEMDKAIMRADKALSDVGM